MSDTKHAPGTPDFDVDGASKADYDKHVEILRRRQEVAGLTPVTLTSETTAPAVAGPLAAGPGEVLATHPEQGERIFTDVAWNLLKDGTETRGGWEATVEKPALAK